MRFSTSHPGHVSVGIKPDNWYLGIPELLACEGGRNLTEHHSLLITNYIGRGEATMRTKRVIILPLSCVISNHHISCCPRSRLHGIRVPASKHLYTSCTSQGAKQTDWSGPSTLCTLCAWSYPSKQPISYSRARRARKPNDWPSSQMLERVVMCLVRNSLTVNTASELSCQFLPYTGHYSVLRTITTTTSMVPFSRENLADACPVSVHCRRLRASLGGL